MTMKTMKKMKKNNLKAAEAAKNFWKKKIQSVILTPIESGFETNIELVSFNNKIIGNKIVPYYKVKEEIKSLGFSKYY